MMQHLHLNRKLPLLWVLVSGADFRTSSFGCNSGTFREEYDLDLVTTAPGVVYKVYKTNGEVIEITNPSNMPDPSEIDHMEEPVVTAEIMPYKRIYRLNHDIMPGKTRKVSEY